MKKKKEIQMEGPKGIYETRANWSFPSSVVVINSIFKFSTWGHKLFRVGDPKDKNTLIHVRWFHQDITIVLINLSFSVATVPLQCERVRFAILKGFWGILIVVPRVIRLPHHIHIHLQHWTSVTCLEGSNLDDESAANYLIRHTCEWNLPFVFC